MRRMYGLAFVLAFVGLAAPAAVRADQVIYSNLGPGGTYFGGAFAVTDFQSVAAPFTVMGSSNFSLSRIDIALTFFRSEFPVTTDATLELLNNSGSATPGSTVLSTWNLTNLPNSTSTSIQPGQTISGITGITLDAGTTYWLAVFAPSGRIDVIDTWDSATSNQSLGTAAISQNAGGMWFPVNGGNLAFDVLGTPAPPAQEPSSLLLLGGGLLTLVGLARHCSCGARP